MAIVINGSGTVTGLAVGGLPDGTVDAGTLATNSVDSAELIDGAVDDSHIAALASSKLTGALPAISGANLTNLPASGISQTDQWRITTNFTGDVNPIENNWERDDTSGFGKMGSGMSVSSGHWTFPATGLYKIEFNMIASGNLDSREVYGYIVTTNNNSTWINRAELNSFIQQTESNVTFCNAHASCFLAVTSTTNCKARFKVLANNTSRTVNGSSTENRTYVTFTRVGDN